METPSKVLNFLSVDAAGNEIESNLYTGTAQFGKLIEGGFEVQTFEKKKSLSGNSNVRCFTAH